MINMNISAPGGQSHKLQHLPAQFRSLWNDDQKSFKACESVYIHEDVVNVFL